MANRERGQVSIDIDGKAYKLVYSTNALCELEDALNRNVNSITAEVQDPSKVRLKTLRAMFWAGLTEHHPDIDLKAAGNLMTIGGASAVMTKVGEAFRLAFPEADEVNGRPPAKPAATKDGAGLNS